MYKIWTLNEKIKPVDPYESVRSHSLRLGMEKIIHLPPDFFFFTMESHLAVN